MRIMGLDISSHVYPADVTIGFFRGNEHIVKKDVVCDVKMMAETLTILHRPQSIKDVASLPFAIFLVGDHAVRWILATLQLF